uniref:DDE Tnp4 domain-containing protein n=1 Tax=Strigamia maritima TaxID=126957 RepID=T1J8I5_STRMM
MDVKLMAMISLLKKLEDDLSSSEDDDELTMLMLLRTNNQRIKRRRPNGYAEDVVAKYTPDEFQEHFRLSRTTFEWLLEKIAPSILHEGVGRPTIEVDKQLLMTIWLLTNQETYKQIANRFAVAEQTVWNRAINICNVLVSSAPQFVSWPEGNCVGEIIEGFKQIAGFPDVIGVIGGTHIPIKAPRNWPTGYACGKKFFYILVQAICDHRGIFTDIHIGEVGAVAGQEVYAKSEISSMMEADVEKYTPQETCLLGNGCYALTKNMMTPYPDVRLTETQAKFNAIHAETWRISDRAFGLLKGRFRRLKYLDMGRADLIPVVAHACCILHNVCQIRDDPPVELSELNNSEEQILSSEQTQEGIDKRDYIAALL